MNESVLLFNSRLRLFPGKLRSRWSRAFEVIRVSESGIMEVWKKSTGKFLVNGQRLKHYHPSDNVLDKGFTLILYPS